MKTNYAATALVLALGVIASTSFAGESGALTREQVRASVLQARADGTLLPVNDRSVRKAKSEPSTLTREAVMAEYFAAKKTRVQYLAMEQDVMPAVQEVSATPRSRAEVRAEAVLSVKNHTQEYGG